jgi:hypothetical protein
MRILIVVLLATLGFIFGFAGGMDLSSGNIEFAVMLGSAGGALGLTLSDLLYRLISPRPRRRRPMSTTPTRMLPPREFASRLAQFAGDVQTPNSDVTADRRRSRMPFWSAVDSFVRVPPKSAALIRRTLLKIRALLGRSVSQ